jgi:8-oxo-dGTP pyrophosphatase MutT (NUDIX family)
MPLKIADAAAALILVDGGYLMQLRDGLPDIWYPGHWGLFGGGIEPGEDPVAALCRELEEELELVPRQAELFARFEFDLTATGLGRHVRAFYVVTVPTTDLPRLVLHEGADMRVFSGSEILHEPRVVPYDSFALYLHHGRARIA